MNLSYSFAIMKEVNNKARVRSYHEKFKEKQSQKSPGNTAFQTDDALVIKWLLAVIPPECSEQLNHNVCCHKFHGSCHHHGSEIQLHRLSCQRLKNQAGSQRTKTINDAKRAMSKSPVQHRAAVLIAEHGTFQKVTDETKCEKPVNRMVNRHIHCTSNFNSFLTC